MNYTRLLKLLYWADRGALLSWGRPWSGDKYFSRKWGPVLSEVHDLMTEMPPEGQANFWSQHVSAPASFEVELKKDPGDDDLSRAEEKLIDEIFAACGHHDTFDLVRLLHRTLPEWKEVESGRLPIEFREIPQAGGKSPEDIEEIESELDRLRPAESILKIA